MSQNLKNKILAVIVNYGDEQFNYLRQVVKSLKSFMNYKVTVVINSNIDVPIDDVDKINIIKLEDYKMLPLTCRKVLWENRNNFDIFIYSENDHLFLESHVEKHVEYSEILPQNRIPGLIQFEENETGRFYPGYHSGFDWDFKKVETYGGKKFGHFSNLHQASFILTRNQLNRVSQKFDFTKMVLDKESLRKRIYRRLMRYVGIKIKWPYNYDSQCKACTDIYLYGGMKKVICISEFEQNLIHHLPNLYIEGEKGRLKLGSSHDRMEVALKRLLEK